MYPNSVDTVPENIPRIHSVTKFTRWTETWKSRSDNETPLHLEYRYMCADIFRLKQCAWYVQKCMCWRLTAKLMFDCLTRNTDGNTHLNLVDLMSLKQVHAIELRKQFLGT